jgi:hypothetical protein
MTTSKKKKKKINGRRKGTPSLSLINDDDGKGIKAKPSSMPLTNDNGVNELSFGNLNITVDDSSSSSCVAHQWCAACVKESSDLKTCGGCNLVKYCDARCDVSDESSSSTQG